MLLGTLSLKNMLIEKFEKICSKIQGAEKDSFKKKVLG
jgi:hypothetical protein